MIYNCLFLLSFLIYSFVIERIKGVFMLKYYKKKKNYEKNIKK